MKTLIFDIETVGEDWEAIDTKTQEVLSRWINRSVHTQQERELRLGALKDELGLSPVTGAVTAIGVYDLQRSQGAVYYTGEYGEKDIVAGEYLFKERSEKEMLRDFWEGALLYDTFVTFNGRSFDIPYILHRSVVHGVLPTVDLMGARYLDNQKTVRHVDLQDQLTFYRAMAKRPSLHLFCRAYGIEISGADSRNVAQQSAGKVSAIGELYKKWLDYLAPEFFKNSHIN